MNKLSKVLPEIISTGFIIAILIMFLVPMTYVMILVGDGGLRGEVTPISIKMTIIALDLLAITGVVVMIRQASKKVRGHKG